MKGLLPPELFENESSNVTKFCFGEDFDQYKFPLPKGKGNKGILVVLPPIVEGESRIPLLQNMLKDYITSIENDCYVYYSLVQPHKKLQLEHKHISCCRKQMWRNIQTVKYTSLYLVGEFCFNLVYPEFSGRLKNKGYEEFLFDSFYGDQFNCEIYVLPSNSFCRKYTSNFRGRRVLREEAQTFQKIKIKAMLERPKRIEKVVGHIQRNQEVNLTDEKVLTFLKMILASKCPMAFDYETNQLKSNDQTSQIFCVGVYSEKTGKFAFLISDVPKQSIEIEIENTFKEILKDKDILKIAHNIYFEQSWSINHFGQEIVNGYCTQIAEYVIDNSKSVSLKALVFRYFGKHNYDNYIDDYITTNEKISGYSKNKLHLADPIKMKDYCVLDCIYTYLIWMLQQDYFHKDKKTERELKGAKLLIDGSLELGSLPTMGKGIRFDRENCIKVDEYILQKLQALNKEIRNLVRELSGDKVKLFDHNKEDHINYLFFDLLKHDKENWPKTPSGKPKMSKDILINHEKDHKVIQLIVLYRKYDKLYRTYIPSITREINNLGYVTPTFSLTSTATFRSSCSLPNFQNMPKRDKDQMDLIRSLMFPKLGHKIVEYDYKAIEVCIAAHYYKDPVLRDYVADSSKDMHRDTALGIFILTLDEYNNLPYNKTLRFAAKNGYVFPAFYGSLGVNSAAGMWKLVPKEIMPHLKKHGIDNLNSWTKHVENYDNVFWGQRFKIFAENKEKLWTHYKKTGKVALFTGVQGKRIMNHNECINMPIQGPAFHCLLRLLTYINRWLKSNNCKSYIMNQVHDSLVMSVHPSEEDTIDSKVKEIGERQIVKEFGIEVPLTLEKESAKINESWNQLRST